MKHFYLELPGPNWFSGAEIYRRFVKSVRNPSIAVELGAWKGRSTCFMAVEIANSNAPIRFFTIDHWQGSIGEEGHDADTDKAEGRLFETFVRNTEPVASYVQAIRSDSASAAEGFEDDSVDFLYVDASHTCEAVLRDLRAWYPKLKIGGVIAGDDWCFENGGDHGVRRAVLLFFGQSALRLRLEPGSLPNQAWIQWSLVKKEKRPKAARSWLRILLGKLAMLRFRMRNRWAPFAQGRV
ncbi:MAG TPA: class I SAM-dependent methyltransferase [Sphingomicrobium sp.]|jgi:hypothetical protein|nr:class I SAM-dependent methyltransferase [Sphingomicrobium sp.]